MNTSYDYIVVGAGSAGCVLANRLADKHRVLLLEAGPKDHWWDFRLHMPAALSHVLTSDTYNWFYHSEPEANLEDRPMYCPRGRVLGGSSSINGMIFVRGNRGDFDRWKTEYGLHAWGYEDCLPYFRRMETCAHGDDVYRGRTGPIRITRGDVSGPLNQAWLAACTEAGHGFTSDYNGAEQAGGCQFDMTIGDGRRFSAARGYLAAPQGSLDIETGVLVRDVIIENGAALGVRLVDRRGQEREVRADAEVVLSAGAINSPQVLMRSGIGPAEELVRHNINCIADLPVGENLMDHLEIYVQYECLKPVSIAPYLSWYRKPFVGMEWYLASSGPGATNHFHAGAFLKSGLDDGYPDLQCHFLPVAMNYDGSERFDGHGFQVHIGPMKPRARGRVTLSGAGLKDSPVINFNYHDNDHDRDVMHRGIRMVDEIVSTGAFDGLRGERLADLSDEAAIERFIRERAESAYHPSGTCAMGQVVDEAGRVLGIDNLRVADASLMPEITNGNLNAVVIMMAEKVAAQMTGDLAVPD